MMLVFEGSSVKMRWVWLVPFLAFFLCALVQADPKTAPRLTLSELEHLENQELGAEGLVLEVPGGSVLPLKLRLKGELATAESGEIPIRFQRDIYVYLPGKKGREPQFSSDGRTWKTWQKVFQGSVSAAASKSGEREGLELVIDWGIR